MQRSEVRPRILRTKMDGIWGKNNLGGKTGVENDATPEYG